MGETHTALGSGDYAVILAYFAAFVAIGYLARPGQEKDSRAFLLGGGRMPAFALGISCLMAAMSSFSLVMVPGEIFNHGLSFWVLGLVNPLFMPVACALFLRFYFRIGAFTPYEYLGRRYSPAVRTLVALLSAYGRLIYLGMVLFSTSKIFEGAAGWPNWLTILACGGVALVFSAMGGLKAIVWTDVMQFVVLVGGLGCILAMLFWKIDGGPVGAVVYAFEHGRGPTQFSRPEFYTLNPYVRLSFWLLLMRQFLGPIGTLASDQMTVQRLLAAGDYRSGMKTQFVNTCLSIPTLLVLWLIGLSVFSFFSQHPELPVKSGDTALFTFIATQLPSPLPGLVIAAMLAAVISTLNAVFNSLATVYLKEFHIRHISPGLSEDRQVAVSRIATVAVGLIGIGLGLLITLSAEWLRQSVVEAQTVFYIFDAVVGPAFFYAILSRRASTLLVWTAAGALAGVKLAMIAWYSLSTSAANAWEEGLPPGLAGPLDPVWILPGLAAGLALLAAWFWLRRRAARGEVVVLFAAAAALGFAGGIGLWAFFSAYYSEGRPLAVSFQWLGLPVDAAALLIGVVWLSLGKAQPPEKYRGLTLFDKGS